MSQVETLRANYADLERTNPEWFANVNGILSSRGPLHLNNHYDEHPFPFLPPLMHGHPDVHVRTAILDAARLASQGVPDAEHAFFVADLCEVYRQHQRWRLNLPEIQPHYAVKANPDPYVLRLLAALGAGFDCASNLKLPLRDDFFEACILFSTTMTPELSWRKKIQARMRKIFKWRGFLIILPARKRNKVKSENGLKRRKNIVHTPPETNPSQLTAIAAAQDPEATETQCGLIVPSVEAHATEMTTALPASWNGMFDIFNVEYSIQPDTSTPHINKLPDSPTRPVSAQDSTNIAELKTPFVPPDHDDHILGRQANIPMTYTTPTLEDPNQQKNPREMARTAWHGLKLISTNVASLLEGTPFHLPFSIFNTLSGIVDTVIENNDKITTLLQSIAERMCVMSESLPNFPNDSVAQMCDRFYRTLTEAMEKLAEMRDSGSLIRILEADEYPQAIKDIVMDIGVTKRIDFASPTPAVGWHLSS